MFKRSSATATATATGAGAAAGTGTATAAGAGAGAAAGTGTGTATAAGAGAAAGTGTATATAAGAGAAALVVLLLIAGCGSSSSSTSAAPGSGSTSSAAGSEGSAALSADAKSAATGDIPDTQNFLTFRSSPLGVSMLYPEGWTVRETPGVASIAAHNNLVRISLSKGAAVSPAAVSSQLAALKSSAPTLAVTSAPSAIKLRAGLAVKAVYKTQSAPNPVTGKQVTLIVDRYVLAHNGRVAVVDLGTPTGVDNVDAYRKMIESFKWR